MNRDEALDLLREQKPALAKRFGVIRLALFGSFARDQAPDRSNMDILVEFDTSPDWKNYLGAVSYLEDILGRPVDMATRSRRAYCWSGSAGLVCHERLWQRSTGGSK